MQEIKFSFNNVEYDQHECDSVTEGDWVIFRCPICRDYERKINAVTGEMMVKNASTTFRHSGLHLHRTNGNNKALMN
jgi:hypothetical protein